MICECGSPLAKRLPCCANCASMDGILSAKSWLSFDIVQCLRAAGMPLSMDEITAEVREKRNTVEKRMYALRDHGFVRQLPKGDENFHRWTLCARRERA